MSNKQYFYQVAEGNFGRKTIYYKLDKDVLGVDKNNILDVLENTKSTFEDNSKAIDYLWNYYKGDQPAHYREKVVRSNINNKVVENHAYEIVMFKNGQTYGEPITYVNTSGKEEITQYIDLLNNYCRVANKDERDLSMGEWQSATGIGFKAIYNKDDKDSIIPFGISVPTPLDTWFVYNSENHEKLACFQKYKDGDEDRYLAFTSTHSYVLSDEEILEEKPHTYGDIPIVAFPNNQNCISDIEVVIDLLDAINSVQSNRIDSIDQFVQTFLLFVNCDIDENSIQQMRENGAISVRSRPGEEGKADVRVLSTEMNQSNGQKVKDDLWKNTMSILAIPNREGNTGGDAQGAVELRNGWDFSKTRAMIKDAYVKKSEREFASLVLHRLKQVLGETAMPVTEFDFDVHIVHSPTDNLYTKTESLKMLLDSGIDPLTAIKTCGLWSDCEKVFLMSSPYLKAKYKTIDELFETEVDPEEEAKAKALLEQSQSGGVNE